MKSQLKKCLTAALIATNLLVVLPSFMPVVAQRLVTVTADQPNIWTLEQAHYLLAQMHRRNLDLKASPLGLLDANEINGINVDVLRTLLEAGATYNEADRFNNGLIKEDKSFNSDRRRQLIRDLDELNKESVDRATRIARLKREKETTDDEAKKAAIEAEIIEQTEVKAAYDRQIELKNTELGTLNAASGNVAATSSSATFNAGKFPSGGFDETFRKKAADIISSFNTNPQLNASLKLDNFLQLQYEIISKQLTLLRDEVGPGERLIFLELPQSINATFDRSDDMWAQSRWKIRGYTHCVIKVNQQSVPCPAILSPLGAERSRNRPGRSTVKILGALASASTGNDFYELSLADIQDPEAFAKRFSSRRTDDFTATLRSDVSIESELAMYRETRDRLAAAEKDYERLANGLAASCGQRLESGCAALEELKNQVSDLKKRVREPSPLLLNGLLSLLNKYIGDAEQLNQQSEWNGVNVSSRTKLLGTIKANDKSTNRLFNRLWIEDLYSNELYRLSETNFQTEPVDLDKPIVQADLGNLTTEDRKIRTIEILPRQSSLNVNDIKIRNKSSVFNFVASTLFGLGANFNYQQQREKYSQFVQQELYSSGFGKGSREFGWTFTSMPGSDRLLSGTRTTYAIAIIPQDATSVFLESTGCSFDRRSVQPGSLDAASKDPWLRNQKNSCSAKQAFEVQIPGAGADSDTDFDVTGLTYKPVKNGKTVVISIYGRNFSSQIGVMVNGVSLPSSIGIAQRFIRDDSTVGGSVKEEIKQDKIKGNFERIDSGQILVAFQQIDGEEGTPVITLVAPGKGIDLNSISDLYINGVYRTSLKDSEWMFGKKPRTDVSIKDFQIFVSQTGSDGVPTELTALLTGTSFGSISNIFINGVDPACSSVVRGRCVRGGESFYFGQSIYVVKFSPPSDDKIRFVVASGDETFALDPIVNPAKTKKAKDPASLRPGELNFAIAAVRPVYADSKREKITYLLVEIAGVGLSSDLNVSLGQLDVVDSNKAFLTILDPKPAQTIRLTDTKKNIYAEGVVTIPNAPVPATSPSP